MVIIRRTQPLSPLSTKRLRCGSWKEWCRKTSDSKERAEHRNRVVAPQTSMTPDNVFRHAYDPTGHAGVAGILKFPLSPEFFSRRWMDVTGTVIPIATEAAFMTIVVLARVK